jgi:UPF0271 protein
VKAHGIFYKMIDRDEALAEAYIRALRELAPDLIVVTEMGTQTYDKARKSGVRVVTEAFPDLKYGADGHWIIEKSKEPRRPEEVIERAVMIAREGKVKTVEGQVISVPAQTICLHGDAPNAPDVARAVNAALRNAGVELLPMMKLV